MVTKRSQLVTRKKIKTGGANIRQECRVACGADVIIGLVMPYLISTGDDDFLPVMSPTQKAREAIMGVVDNCKLLLL